MCPAGLDGTCCVRLLLLWTFLPGAQSRRGASALALRSAVVIDAGCSREADGMLADAILGAEDAAGMRLAVRMVTVEGVRHTWAACPQVRSLEVGARLGLLGSYMLHLVSVGEVFSMSQCASCRDALEPGGPSARYLREQSRPLLTYARWLAGEESLCIAVRDCTVSDLVTPDMVRRMLDILRCSRQESCGGLTVELDRRLLPDEIAWPLAGGTHRVDRMSLVTVDEHVLAVMRSHVGRDGVLLLGPSVKLQHAAEDIYTRLSESWPSGRAELWEVARTMVQ